MLFMLNAMTRPILCTLKCGRDDTSHFVVHEIYSATGLRKKWHSKYLDWAQEPIRGKVAISDPIEFTLIYILTSIDIIVRFIFHEIASLFDEMKTFHGLSNSPKDTRLNWIK